MESKVEHEMSPMNVFLFNKKINKDIEVSCNLKILRNCKRTYFFTFFYTNIYNAQVFESYVLFEMSETLNNFKIQSCNGLEIIEHDMNLFEEKLNYHCNDISTCEVHKIIFDWIKENYLKLNSIFPVRFGF